MMEKLSVLLPLLAFMGLMLAVSFAVRVRREKEGAGFVSQYFIGSRAIGGFVLAMTTVATYSSVSSFVGGPGMAWKVGFGWIYMAVVQVTAIFLVLGIFGSSSAARSSSRRLRATAILRDSCFSAPSSSFTRRSAASAPSP